MNLPEGMEGAPVVETVAPSGTEAAPVAEATTSEVVGSTESEASTASVLDIDSYGEHVVTIKVDGEERQVPLKEALEGHMRQADYTRKSQEVAERRRQVEAYEQLDEAFRSDPKGTLEALARQAGVDFGATDPIVDLDPEEARMRKVEEFMQADFERREQDRLDGKIQSLRETYGEANVDEGELLQYAVKKGFKIDTLEDAFKAFHYDKAIEQARATAVAEKESGEQQRLDAKGALPPVAGGASNGGPVTAGAKPITNIREAFAAARETHRI